MRAKPFRARPLSFRPADERKPSERKLDEAMGLKCIGEFVTPEGVGVTVNEPVALTELVMHYRALRRRTADRIGRDEVRETLRRLAGMHQNEAASRWRGLDMAVRVEIDRANWQLFRLQHGPNAMYAKGIRYIKSGPDNLPAMAASALETMQQHGPGRVRITALAIMFASALAAHWFETEKRRPTVQNDEYYSATDFQKWAEALFTQAGFPTGDIYKHLQAGLIAAKQAGRIPE